MGFDMLKWDKFYYQNWICDEKREKLFLIIRLIQLSRIIAYVEFGSSMENKNCEIDLDFRNIIDVNEDELKKIYEIRESLCKEYFDISFYNLRSVNVSDILNKVDMVKRLENKTIFLFSEFQYLNFIDDDEYDLEEIVKRVLNINPHCISSFNSLDSFFI